MKKKTATPIRDVTKGVIKEISKQRREKQERTKRAWQKAVGKKHYQHTQPVSFRKKKLVVNIDSSGLLYELTIRKRDITAKLKKDLKDDFQEVRFRIGEIES
jgi:predicted nucleic acid-binding Zn ribbon protein